MEEVVNKVAQAGLETVNLSQFRPDVTTIVTLDLAEFTAGEPIVREKVFRQELSRFNLNKIQNRLVCLTNNLSCIVQPWAWMLLAAKFHNLAEHVYIGPWDDFKEADTIVRRFRKHYSPEYLKGIKLLISGCANFHQSAYIYQELTTYVLPYVQTLMFGEACSAVPVFKASKKTVI